MAIIKMPEIATIKNARNGNNKKCQKWQLNGRYIKYNKRKTFVLSTCYFGQSIKLFNYLNN